MPAGSLPSPAPVRRAAAFLFAVLVAAGGTQAAAAPPDHAAPAADAAGAEVVVVRDGPDGPTVATLPAASPAAARRLADELDAHPDVRAAEPNRTWTAFGDPYRDLQWGMDRLRAESTWGTGDAGGRTIAVLDTGVDRTHEDLAGRVLTGYDFLRDTPDGGIDPCPSDPRHACMGHGTGVAGIAGAIVDNEIGIAGFGRDVQILPVRVLDERGQGRTDNVVAGIYWAANEGAEVINLSLGGLHNDRAVSRAVEDASNLGAVVVAAAGNHGEDAGYSGQPVYPAAHPRALGVTATRNADDDRTSFSSWGTWVDLAAPGQSILTTRPQEASPSGDPYRFQTGTSFATPFVAAAAAMVKERYPRATPSQVAWRLRSTATDIGSPGKDRFFGHGLVDAREAMLADPDAGCRPDPDEPVVRVWDRARVETAVAVACDLWPADTTRTVVLATASQFPDALAGAALAARHNAPLLLTTPQGLSPAAAEMIHQLGAERVILLGGTAALSTTVEQDLIRLGVDRLERVAGPNRYATAGLIARRAKVEGAPEVVLASGTGFADAVSAGALVATPGRPPVLLTAPDRLPAETLDALERLGTTSVLVLGGTSAVSRRVVTELEGRGLAVRRLAGLDRYETSAVVTREALTRMDGPAEILLASGAGFPDALAGGAAAARLDVPLLLVPPTDLSSRPSIEEVLEEFRWERARVIGGRQAVGEDVRQHAAAYVSGG